MIDLKSIAYELNAPILDEMKPPSIKVLDKDIERISIYFASKYGTAVIIYGGQTATPLFWGFKNMRRHTNDIDYLVKKEIIRDLVSTEKLSFNPTYNVFFQYIDNIVCVFSVEKIHDFHLPNDFYDAVEIFHLKNESVAVCSREYTITLKLRRAASSNKDLFGKDAIDIINLIVAPIIRDDLSKIDYKKTAHLIAKYACSYPYKYFKSIYDHCNHIPADIYDKARAEIDILFNTMEKL